MVVVYVDMSSVAVNVLLKVVLYVVYVVFVSVDSSLSHGWGEVSLQLYRY